MRKLLLLGVVASLMGMTAMALSSSQDRTGNGNAGIRARFAGAWRLASLEVEGADGKIHKADSAGLLVFTRDGHMSVQVMERNPHSQPSPQPPDGPQQYSQGGYEASFGTYEIDESTHTFTYHVEGALVRTLVGKDLPRAFEFSGQQLIVKSTRPEEHWRATWEHY